MKDAALYLEVDEDITSAIDKLTKTDGTAVQIVVPKRSTMLQSIINLKLLKKAASDAGKELVLVTSDKIATDLAGRIGLAVAPSLGAKPVLAENVATEAPSNEDIIEEDDPEPVKSVPAPVAAAPKPAKKPLFARKAVEEPAAVVAATGAAGEVSADSVSSDAAKAPVSKGVKVPNFNLLRRRLVWVGAAVALVVAYVVFMALFSGAKVTLYAAGSKVQIDTNFAVDTSGPTNAASAVLAGQSVSAPKDLNESITPTGQKDNGTKATGQMTVKNEYDSSPHTLSAGTRFAAPDGKIFRTNDDVTVPGATPIISHGQLSLQAGTATVAVTADQNGDSYNEASARYTIVAYTGDMQAKIYGQGGQMSGGTSKVVTVVSQDDIDKAKADLLAKDKDSGNGTLKNKMPSGYQLLDSSLQQAATNVSSSPAVGQEATSATVTVTATYTALAVKSSDFETFIKTQEQTQVGSKSQIYDDGLGSATITAGDKDSSGRATFKLDTQAYSGAKLDTDAIAAQIKGQKYGDAVDTATKQPGVQRAEISLTPAWATSLPGNVKKIHITIQVAAK